ncbi:succinate dehydrogenase assembly factor 2 [Acinetobacter nectaris]|uniref:FAD assembly factor SdhE n=1 Tax=Acinetobacter nectaris TaxID=1219382 RepID=UPI001F316242|nr:succinate dehydrogenase assembly factor 2 [Acinetobacter nectaris]MCF9028222.1 succinate dehydrogenase assembly factor 2 [Acinetobacter nectaris]MCF9034534.1 succinate dehydrogenase assembly factor 2 [Acinetobacter nectaris]
MTDNMTLIQRKTIYRARRGLKEIDVYFDPYVKNYYLKAPLDEQVLFETLITYEDPDILDWLMETSEAPTQEMQNLIIKLKNYVHG